MAGVSQPTVSRALSGHPSVSAETRARVMEAARELNYSVDKNASGLRRQQSRTIALLFFEDPTPDDTLINPFYLSMVGAMTRACAQAGYDLLISFQQLSSDWHTDYEDSRKADGIILLGYGDYLQALPGLEQLVKQGPHFVERHAGYRRALAEAGIAPDPALVVDCKVSEEDGVAAIDALEARGKPYDAIFVADDLAALGAMHRLHALGRSVPDDVSIVGFDDIAAARLAEPPLTTVAQDRVRAGEVLVRTLIAKMEENAPDSVLIPVELLIRESA